jgi:hypothetical protein
VVSPTAKDLTVSVGTVADDASIYYTGPLG